MGNQEEEKWIYSLNFQSTRSFLISHTKTLTHKANSIVFFMWIAAEHNNGVLVVDLCLWAACLLGKLSDYIGNHGFFSFHNTDYAHLIIPHTSKTETILR